jgi:glycosyltransferase 2 family protein
MKSRALNVLKVVLAVGLLVYLVAGIGPARLGLVLRSFDVRYFVWIYLLQFADLFLRAANWRALLRTRNARVPLLETVRHYLVGGFLGSVIPSSLGTDVGRAYQVAQRHRIPVQDVSLAIVVLNLVGLLATCLMALAGAALLVALGGNTTILWGIVPVAAGYVLLFPILLGGWMPEPKFTRWPAAERLLATIRGFSGALREFRGDRRALATVLGIALVNQFLAVVMVFVTSRALGTGAPFYYFVALMPMMTISRLIPASIAGFGAEQGVFVLLFALAGVPAATAFFISLTLSATALTFVLLGGVIYAFEHAGRLRHRG